MAVANKIFGFFMAVFFICCNAVVGVMDKVETKFPADEVITDAAAALEMYQDIASKRETSLFRERLTDSEARFKNDAAEIWDWYMRFAGFGSLKPLPGKPEALTAEDITDARVEVRGNLMLTLRFAEQTDYDDGAGDNQAVTNGIGTFSGKLIAEAKAKAEAAGKTVDSCTVTYKNATAKIYGSPGIMRARYSYQAVVSVFADGDAENPIVTNKYYSVRFT